MTVADFYEFWSSAYSMTLPLSYKFKLDHPDRWLRIHSLPLSKRYPETDAEWAFLLERQNAICHDLIGENATFILVYNDYFSLDDSREERLNRRLNSVKKIQLTELEVINLNQVDPDIFNSESMMMPMISEEKWQAHKYDNILRDIANDDLRVFFMSIATQCLIAPYDGGVDMIFKDSETLDYYKEKYRAWLSTHPEAL